MSKDAQSQDASRLVGWKRIGGFLGCSERTARRWEREEGLPVHRQVHDAKSTVYAFEGELTAWVSSRRPEAPAAENQEFPTGRNTTPLQASKADRFRLLALAAACVALIGAVAFLLMQSTPPAMTDTDLPVRQAALTDDPVALDLYERARALWAQRGAEPNRRAIAMLSEAVERDAEFAAAWSALASAWATYATYSDEVTEERAFTEAMLAADRAVRLDPTFAEPRSLMAHFAQRKGDWSESERIYREAVAADPQNPIVRLWFAAHYRELGMFEEATALTEQARNLAPNSPPVLTEIAMNLFPSGRPEQAEAMIDHLWTDIGLQTPVIWTGKLIALLKRGDIDGLEAWLPQMPFAELQPVFARFVEFQRNNTPAAAEAFEHDVREAYLSGFPAWYAYFLLEQAGRPKAALDILEAESEQGWFSTSVVLFDPEKPEARSSERFAEIAERLGYIDYWREAGAPTVCRSEADAPFCQRILAQ